MAFSPPFCAEKHKKEGLKGPLYNLAFQDITRSMCRPHSAAARLREPREPILRRAPISASRPSSLSL